ncbi:MAG: proprotein convertase P-domain-containing protein, partial [Luteibaculum sp.]
MRFYLSLFGIILGLSLFGQSPQNNDCSTAQSLVLDENGEICVFSQNEFPTESQFSVTQNPACNTTPKGPDLFYRFVASGSNLNINLNPLGVNAIDDPIVFLFSGDCSAYALVKCVSNIGNNPVQLIATVDPGKNYFLLVASTTENFGDYELCISNNDDTDDPGDRCAVAGRLCNKANIAFETLDDYQSSGTFPNCFSFQARRDVWLTWTVSRTGTCEFIIDPEGTAEYDWALFDVTNGCPDPNNGRPTAIRCNYNYANEVGAPTGMSENPGSYPNPGEISSPVTLTQGKTYALLIDNFSKTNEGFAMEWGGTFEIISSDFNLSNVQGCDSVVVEFEHPVLPNHTYDWDFGDGTTFSGSNPPVKTYRNEGSYLVSLEVQDLTTGCNAVSTQLVSVSKPKIKPNFSDTTICEQESLYMSVAVELTEMRSPINFSNRQDLVITDNSAGGIKSPINVNLPGNPVLEAGDIKNVCLNINHSNVGDLLIELEAPNGSTVTLVNRKGQGTANFKETCFNNESVLNISGSSAPYSNTYKPQDSFNDLSGIAANGTWNLIVRDLNPGAVGLLDDWSISLENRNEGAVVWEPYSYFEDSSKTVQIVDLAPGLSSDTTYEFTVSLSDVMGCEVDTTISVKVRKNFNAGEGSSQSFCNQGTINLFDYFQEAPDNGGTWVGSQGNAGLNSTTGELVLDSLVAGSYAFTY